MPIIYKIQCRNTGKCYIGSTNMQLSDRIYKHLQSTLKGINPTNSKEIIKNGNYELVQLEECSEEVRKIREKWHIEQNRAICVNRMIPWTSEDVAAYERKQKNEKTGINAVDKNDYKKQYMEKNKEHIRSYNGYYYKNNLERIKEKRQCECCGGMYNTVGRWNHERTKRHILAANSQE